ncbi:hypothetical protein [Klebsiella phage Kpn13]|uniref:Uncharacterized protein n=1 Tax=Klebsiella phage Kpn13 TaxID=3044024 RepID=A0AAT9V7B0_9CAUD|nr:hypothetical protein [Klebsiella phage Kpn13]
MALVEIVQAKAPVLAEAAADSVGGYYRVLLLLMQRIQHQRL